MFKKLRDLKPGDRFRANGKEYIKTDGALERDGEHWHGLCPDDGSVAFPLKTNDELGTGDTRVEIIDNSKEN